MFQFLGVKVIREDNVFTTSVYRKPSFSGVYTHFDSYMPLSYKFSLVSTIIFLSFSTSTFKSKHSNEVYQIKKRIRSNSKMVVYLIECRVCRKQCNSRTVTTFRARANNYKCTHGNFWKEQKLSNQARNQNVITNIIWRKTIAGFVTWRSQ